MDEDPVVHSFADILRYQAAENGAREAFAFLDPKNEVEDRTTYAELDRRARIVAAALVDSGLAGKRVLLAFPPGLDFVAALYGCFYAAVIAVPLPYIAGKRGGERISAIRNDARPAGVLTNLRLESDAKEMIGELANQRLVWIVTDTLEAERLFDGPTPESEALALLQYTSGSTSDPKGVMLSHANLIANCAMIKDAFGHDERSCGVSWLPLFHDMGLVGHVLQPVYLGALSVLMSPLSFLQRPVRWLEAISQWQATTSGGPSTAFDLCFRNIRDGDLAALDLSSWKVAYCGAEKVRSDILIRFAERFRSCGFARGALFPCYGLAEATLMVSGRHGLVEAAAQPRPDSSPPMPVTDCGPSGSGGHLVIADPETRMPLPAGMNGEVWVAGPHIAQGYWNRPDSDDVFAARLADGSGPYLRTGDLGFLDGGKLVIVGRIKDLIIVNGVKHSAEDIEETVASSHLTFGGASAAAFSIEGEGREEAVVVQEVPRAAVRQLLEADAAAAAASSVVGRHGLRLRDVMLVRAGSLPRTSSGKVQRGKTRAAYLAGAFQRLGEE